MPWMRKGFIRRHFLRLLCRSVEDCNSGGKLVRAPASAYGAVDNSDGARQRRPAVKPCGRRRDGRGLP